MLNKYYPKGLAIFNFFWLVAIQAKIQAKIRALVSHRHRYEFKMHRFKHTNSP